MSKLLQKCSQCERTEAEVKSLVALRSGDCLCDTCAEEVLLFLKGGLAEEPMSVEREVPALSRTPRDIVEFLDQYVIGQEDAKKTLAIAVYGHYKRLAHASPEVELAKSNVLLLGPTGTGKTLLAESVARLLDVPFTVADATGLTQAGYVGADVETVLQRLIQAADGDIARAERGIVFLDEIDKLAAMGAGASVTRDVGGEGVQQALLKIMEGTKVEVPVSGNRKHPNSQVNLIDTTNILFVCSGAFVKLLEKKNKAKAPRTMGFVDIPAVAAEKPSAEVTPEDLFRFGMIPEFVGRLPVIATLQALDQAALERILVEPKNAVVRQMQARFAMEGATLELEEGALAAIAKEAMKLKTGARGARGILEKLLKDALYEVPGSKGARVTLTPGLAVRIEYPLALAA